MKNHLINKHVTDRCLSIMVLIGVFCSWRSFWVTQRTWSWPQWSHLWSWWLDRGFSWWCSRSDTEKIYFKFTAVIFFPLLKKIWRQPIPKISCHFPIFCCCECTYYEKNLKFYHLSFSYWLIISSMEEIILCVQEVVIPILYSSTYYIKWVTTSWTHSTWRRCW